MELVLEILIREMRSRRARMVEFLATGLVISMEDYRGIRGGVKEIDTILARYAELRDRLNKGANEQEMTSDVHD